MIETGLFRGESEFIDARVDRQVTKDADIGFEDLSGWAFQQEMGEVVGNFVRGMPDPIGYGWQQDRIGRVECATYAASPDNRAWFQRSKVTDDLSCHEFLGNRF